MSNADDQRRWRERQRLGITWQPLTCQACSKPHRGRHGALCSRCWEKLTPEGRAARLDRVNRSRNKRKP